MVSELRFISPKLDEDIANAMAIAIAMSSPVTHCDFRDAQTIVLDLTSVVYGVDRRDGKSNRITRLLKVPTLVHLQLGLSLGSLRIHVARAYSVLFLQSRKSTDYFHHSLRRYNACKMKVLGDDTNIGQERIEVIRNDIHNFLAKERMGIEMKLNSIDEATLSEIDTQSNTNRSLQQQDTKSPSMVDDVPDCIHLTNK